MTELWPLKRSAWGESGTGTAGARLSPGPVAAVPGGRTRCTPGSDGAVDAEFTRGGREDDGGVKIAVRLRKQIGHLGFAVLLKDERVAAVGGEKIDIAAGSRTGGDPAARQKSEPPHVAITDLAEKRDTPGSERCRVGKFGGGDSSGAKFIQRNPINAAGIARRHERHSPRRMKGRD